MSRWTLLAAAVAAAGAVVTSGCASAGASGPGALDGAATVVPANAVAFVAASTELASSQWHGLLRPFAQQLAPYTQALGAEVDVAVLPGGRTVAFTQPDDTAKLAALVRSKHAASRVIGGWTAIAKQASTLVAVAGATAHLSDSSLFTQAMAAIPGGALVRAYANGTEAQRLLAALPGQLQLTPAPGGVRFRLRRSSQPGQPVATAQFKWVAAAVSSMSDGLELHAVARDDGITAPGPPRYILHPTTPYTSTLVEEIPAGVLAVADFQVSQGEFEQSTTLPQPLQQLFGSAQPQIVETELDTLLGGETAVYAGGGGLVPQVTLVTQPADTAAAANALDELLASLPATSPLKQTPLVRATIGGQFVVSTSQAGIDAFRGGGPKLSSDAAFLAAEKQVGMTGETTGFAYARVEEALPLLRLVGVKVPQGLPALRSFLAYGSQTPDQLQLSAFLGVG